MMRWLGRSIVVVMVLFFAGLAHAALMADAVHPNEAGYALIAANMFAAVAVLVPEPCVAVLLALGAGLAVLRRRRPLFPSSTVRGRG